MTVKVLLCVAGVLVAVRASALQPLETFLRGARTHAPDNAEARAARAQAAAEANVALGRALPGVALNGTYTRHQDETTLELPGAGGGTTRVTVVPRDQLDGTATLHVPLVDLSTFSRVAAARTTEDALEHAVASTRLGVESAVAQRWHQLVANLALVAASERALAVARASLRVAETRHAAGTVSLLDVDRARAEVERNVQQVASAELQAAVGARALASLSGVEPVLEGEVRLADDLRAPPPLDALQVPDERIPAIAAATRERRAFEQLAAAQRLTLVPSLAGTVTERVTNAEGFSGRDAEWQAVVGLTWTFDLGTLAGIRAQEAAADGARARELRTRLAARDGIHDAWAAVGANVVRSRSARVEAEVAARAADLALERYEVGEATQLDVLQAQRDAFAAEAARIQADADLVNSRAQLRLAAGESLLAAAGAPQPSPDPDSRRERP